MDNVKLANEHPPIANAPSNPSCSPPIRNAMKAAVSRQSSAKLARLVTLCSNIKKSPWLLSRCKDSQSHLQIISDLLRPEDKVSVAVKLESISLSSWSRYLMVASSSSPSLGGGGLRESAILGIDVSPDDDKATIGLVLPIYEDMDLQMDGDGGFNVQTTSQKYSFRPVSVQAMWSALQSLIKAVIFARHHHYSAARSTHGWVSHYVNHLNSAQDLIYHWNRLPDWDLSRESQISSGESTEDVKLMLTMKRKLRDTMTNVSEVDLETVTSKYLREKLEQEMSMKLTKYRRFIDEEMVIIMRQLDSPSLILDYLFLGSEWNASNLEELQRNRIGYVLNVTREIDNFFPGMFKYCNVRVDDTEETQLLRYWNNTYKFIKEAKKNNSRVLVHCKMGVSRSASTVIAYVMKEYGKPFIESIQHVKQRRSCVKPNPGFTQQLLTYEGILGASKHRHNRLFRSRSAEEINKENRSEGVGVGGGGGEEEEEKRPKSTDGTMRFSNDKTDLEDGFVFGDADESLDLRRSPRTSDSASESSSSSDHLTFSIDSPNVTSLLPSVTEADDGTGEEGATREGRGRDDDAAAAREEDENDSVLISPVLGGRGRGGEGEEGMLEVPLFLLNDPAISSTSMLRKWSYRMGGEEDEGGGGGGGRGLELRRGSHRPMERKVLLCLEGESQVRRSNSWPRSRKEKEKERTLSRLNNGGLVSKETAQTQHQTVQPKAHTLKLLKRGTTINS